MALPSNNSGGVEIGRAAIGAAASVGGFGGGTGGGTGAGAPGVAVDIRGGADVVGIVLFGDLWGARRGVTLVLGTVMGRIGGGVLARCLPLDTDGVRT